MRVITNEGVTIICKECDNKAMDGYEYCIKCAVVEGIEI